MKKSLKNTGKFLAAVMCGTMLLGTVFAGSAEAAGPEKVMQLRTKGIEDPVSTGKDWLGDYVTYSDCYVYQEPEQTVNPPQLVPSVLYRVTDAYRYDRNVR